MKDSVGTGNLQSLKNEIEDAIRESRLAHARSLLRSIDVATLPRRETKTIAGFARRAGLPALALRLLKPIILPHTVKGAKLDEPAAPGEIASYALALCSSGAIREGQKLIQSIRKDRSAECLLACAFVNIWSWDYAEAADFLKRYLECPGLTDFQMTSAKLNLAASLDFVGHRNNARTLAGEILPVASAQGWRLIERDARMLLGQLDVAVGEFASARRELEMAMQISQAAQLDALMVEKWLCVTELYQNPQSAAAVGQVEDLKKRAAAASRWEILRDCDYHAAKVLADPDLINRVYFGTPYVSFRRRIEREFAGVWTPEESYLWQPKGRGTVEVDLRSGSVSGTESVLKSGLMLNLVQVLASDFYRPFKLGSLFAKLYPNKSYDVTNSGATVANVIQRLRVHLGKLGLPMDIVCTDQAYALELGEKVALRVWADGIEARGEDDEYDRTVRRLKETFPYRAFTTEAACKVLSLPKSSVKKVLARAVEDRRVLSMGQTRARQFRFLSRARKAA